MAESSLGGCQPRRPIPSGLLGMLVLILLAEWLVLFVEPAINGVLPADWRRTGRLASGSPEVRSASVLCFGDSLVKLGVQPRLLEVGLGQGRRAYNLALCSGRSPASYFLLRRALRSGAKPEAIVVDFNESFLAEPPAIVLRLYAEMLDSGEARELTQTMTRPSFPLTWMALQTLPSARNRFEIRQAILDHFAHSPADLPDKRATQVAHRHNWQRNLGAQVMPKIATPLPSDPASWTWIPPTLWSPDPTNAAYLVKFLELAEAHQIPVFWVAPPLHPGHLARRAELNLDGPFDAYVAQLMARFPRVVLVDARRSKYDASVFIDMAHLDRDGSTVLSKNLAAVLADNLAHPGPRVVALPPFSPTVVAAGGPLPVAR